MGRVEPTAFQTLGESDTPQACLIQYSSGDVGRRFLLDAGLTRLGRAPDCGVCIDHPGVSRRHAELLLDPETALLRDCGSANGTRVNGRPIEGSARLVDGDLIRLGSVALKFYAQHSLDALLHDRIYRMATVDEGTDVFTRRYVLEALERERRRARRNRQPLSLVCLDLDHFKIVNDRFGHSAGDRVLREAAAALRTTIRSTDILGRLGGEEFVVVLPETALEQAIELAERMRAAVAAQVWWLVPQATPSAAPVAHRQTVSLGVAQLSDDMNSSQDLLGAADQRLYAAKNGGRDRVVWGPP